MTVISMIMTYESHINWWKFTYLASSWPVSRYFLFLNKIGINDKVVLSYLNDSCCMTDPCVLYLLIFWSCEVGNHHGKFFLDECKIFLAIRCSFTYFLMSELEAEIVNSSKKHVFANRCIFYLIKP